MQCLILFIQLQLFCFILQATLRGCSRAKNTLNAELRESEEDFHPWLLKAVLMRDTWIKCS